MAKNPITVLKESIEGLKLTQEELKKVHGLVLELNKSAQSIPKAFANIKTPQQASAQLELNTKNLKEFMAIEKEYNRLMQLEEKQLARVALARTKVNKELIKARFETSELNKRAKEAAVMSSTLSGKYKQQSTLLTQLRRRYKDLALTQGENTKEARKLLSQITVLDARLKRIDANVGQFQRSVGNYGKAMQSAGRAARNLAGALGFAGGAFAVVQVLRDASRAVREFDRQVIAVQKTTNLTDGEIKKFKNEVIELGVALKGISIQGLLNASEVAGQMGIQGRDNILRFSKTIEQLKLTSDIVGEEAVRNFAKFIEISNDSVESADKLGSVITELGNNFATTESEILANAIEIQKGIALYDTSAESVLGLAAATSALGSAPEQARSGFQKVFKVLNEAIVLGKDLDKVLALTGQTAEELREEFDRNSVSSFQRFVKGLKDSEDAGIDLVSTLKSLGLNEKRTEAVVGALTKNYDVLADALGRASKEYEQNVALTAEADRAATSLDVHIADLKDSWDAYILSIEKGDGPISNAIKRFTLLASKIIEVFRAANQGKEVFDQKLFTNAKNNIVEALEQMNVAETKRIELIQNVLKNEKLTAEQREGLTESLRRLQFKQANEAVQFAIVKKQSTTEEIKALESQIGLLEEKDKLTESSGDAIQIYNTKEIEKLSNRLQTAKGRLEGINEFIKQNTQDLNSNSDGLDDNTDSLDDNTDALTDNGEARGKIIIPGTIAYYEAMISKLQDEADRLADNSREWFIYQQSIEAAKDALFALKVEFEGINNEMDSIGDAESAWKALDDIVNGRKKSDPIEGLALPDLDAIKDAVDAELELYREREDIKRQLLQDTADFQRDLEYQLRDSIIDIGNSIYESRIMGYEREIERNNEYHDALLDNEELTDEQREALEEERERKNKELEKKKRETERKAAIFNKLAAIAEVSIETAKQVAAIQATVALLKARAALNPLLAPLIAVAQAQVPLVLGTGAAAIAAIAARPIPQYKHGREDGPSEMAIVGDGGKSEAIVKKDGSTYITPDKPTLTYLDKGDKVKPDAQKYLDSISDGELYQDLVKHTYRATLAGQSSKIDQYLMQREKRSYMQSERTVKAIQGIKTQVRLNQSINIGEDLKFLARKNNAL